jgi:hypothetical protein
LVFKKIKVLNVAKIHLKRTLNVRIECLRFVGGEPDECFGPKRWCVSDAHILEDFCR